MMESFLVHSDFDLLRRLLPTHSQVRLSGERTEIGRPFYRWRQPCPLIAGSNRLFMIWLRP